MSFLFITPHSVFGTGPWRVASPAIVHDDVFFIYHPRIPYWAGPWLVASPAIIHDDALFIYHPRIPQLGLLLYKIQQV
jgi:hypothetical protein